ncbi:MAG: phytanoyl-CoA dioxygenase family protein [Pseudomonadota bacterium]
MSLTSDQIQSYRDSGFLLIENAVDQATLKSVRAVIEEYRERSKAVAESDAVFDLGPGHGPETPQLRRLKNPHERHVAFDRLMRSPAIVDPVTDLLGGTCRFDHSKLNFKPSGTAARIEWHQDWAFYPHTNDDLLAVGVMIEDCTPDNGPLMVIPGSHKGPVYDHHHNGVFVGGIPQDTFAHRQEEAVSLTAPAGSISIHHVRTLHASSENTSGRERPLLLYSYSAVDAFPVFVSYELEEYDSRILRGHPTRQMRSANVPMRLHLPRVTKADSIFDDQEAIRTG